MIFIGSLLASGTEWTMGCGWQNMEAGRLAVAVLVGQAGMMGAGTGATAVGRGWILDRVSRKSQ